MLATSLFCRFDPNTPVVVLQGSLALSALVWLLINKILRVVKHIAPITLNHLDKFAVCVELVKCESLLLLEVVC